MIALLELFLIRALSLLHFQRKSEACFWWVYYKKRIILRNSELEAEQANRRSYFGEFYGELIRNERNSLELLGSCEHQLKKISIKSTDLSRFKQAKSYLLI